MIRRLRVRGYKSLKEADIRFSPLTVLFGPNSVGKSNLLDLIHLLSRLASSETIRDAFDGHRGRPLEAFHSPQGFGRDGYEHVLAEKQISFSVECDLEIHPRIVQEVNEVLENRQSIVGTKGTYTKVVEHRLRYAIEVALHPKTGELFVQNESLRALRGKLSAKASKSRRPFFEREQNRYTVRIERQGHPRYFELDRPRTLLSELSDPVYHPHVVATAKEISSWRIYYVEPTSMRADLGVQAASEPGRSGQLLAAYFYYLQNRHPRILRGLVRNLQDLVPGLQDVRVDVREGLLEMVIVHAGGAEFSTRLLSEGTLRLFCILGIAVSPAPPPVVGYEEPENGVNPARLELIARILRNAGELRRDGPQFILTTHSALLCDLLPEQLVFCSWDSEKGTRFEPFPWTRDTLFFEHEILKALDAGTRANKRAVFRSRQLG